MDIVLYESDDTTPFTSETYSTDAGVESAAKECHVWANKGLASGSAPNAYLQAEIEDPLNPGTWLTSGLEPLDNSWFRLQVIDSQNPSAHANWNLAGTAPQAIGSSRRFFIGSMLGDTCAEINVTIRPPAMPGAASATFNWRLQPVYGESLFPTHELQTLEGVGVVKSVGDNATTEMVGKITVTATAVNDAYVNVPWSHSLAYGVPQWKVATAIELNQNDVTPAALGVGEEYLALIYQPMTGVPVALKGAKATAGSSVAPVLGATLGTPLALVTVSYQAATSVISDSDIVDLAMGGRFEPRMLASGLNFVVGAGRAVCGSGLVRMDYESTLTQAINLTRYWWLDATGFVASASLVPPSSGAIPIAEVVTDGTDVTSVTDLRQYRERGLELIRLAIAGGEATGTNVARAMVGYPFAIDRVEAILGTASSGGATGATIVDVNNNGTSIFTNQAGSPESRPSIAAGARQASGMPEATSGAAFDMLSLDVDAITIGGAQGADLEVLVWVYPRY